MGRLCVRFWKGRLLLAPPGGFSVADVAMWLAVICWRRNTAERTTLHSERRQPDGTPVPAQLAMAGNLQPRWLPRLSALDLALLAGLAEGRGGYTARAVSLAATQPGQRLLLVLPFGSGRGTGQLGYRTPAVGGQLGRHQSLVSRARAD